MGDFSNFKKMITPTIIKLLFWVLTITSLVMGAMSIYASSLTNNGSLALLGIGLLWIIGGPIAARVWCEILIVVFSINDTLTDVRNILQQLGHDDPNLSAEQEESVSPEGPGVPRVEMIEGREFIVMACPKCGHLNQFRRSKEGTVQHCKACDEGFVLPSL